MKYFALILILLTARCKTSNLPTATDSTIYVRLDSLERRYARQQGQLNDANNSKTQLKNTIDSLKKVVAERTVLIDTSSASDFKISKGIITFNKPNLNLMIKNVVLQTIPKNGLNTKKKKIK